MVYSNEKYPAKKKISLCFNRQEYPGNLKAKFILLLRDTNNINR